MRGEARGEKIRLREVAVVEGRYDAAALANLVDGLIITTDGFSIFKDGEKKELIRSLGQSRGLLIITDSDAAGFRIRHYIEKIAAGCSIKNAYVPALPGKEGRKRAYSAEGVLGVEGVPAACLRMALKRAEIIPAPNGEPGLSWQDLYELGLSGTPNSALRRRTLLKKLGLPPRLSKRGMCAVLSGMYTRLQLEAFMAEMLPAYPL